MAQCADSMLGYKRMGLSTYQWTLDLGPIHWNVFNMHILSLLYKEYSKVSSISFFYHCLNVSRAMVMWPPCWKVTDWLIIIEQTWTNMSHPGRRPGTHVGPNLNYLLSHKNANTLQEAQFINNFIGNFGFSSYVFLLHFW